MKEKVKQISITLHSRGVLRITGGMIGSMVERPPPMSILASSKQAEGSGFESQVVRYFGNDQESGLNSLPHLLLFRWPPVPHEDPTANHVEFGHDLSSAFGNAVRSSEGLGSFRRLDRLFFCRRQHPRSWDLLLRGRSCRTSRGGAGTDRAHR